MNASDVYAQNILGDDPTVRLGRNPGFPARPPGYQSATQWILGIRPEYKRLRINPASHPIGMGFRCRQFRGKPSISSAQTPTGFARVV